MGTALLPSQSLAQGIDGNAGFLLMPTGRGLNLAAGETYCPSNQSADQSLLLVTRTGVFYRLIVFDSLESSTRCTYLMWYPRYPIIRKELHTTLV